MNNERINTHDDNDGRRTARPVICRYCPYTHEHTHVTHKPPGMIHNAHTEETGRVSGGMFLPLSPDIRYDHVLIVYRGFKPPQSYLAAPISEYWMRCYSWRDWPNGIHFRFIDSNRITWWARIPKIGTGKWEHTSVNRYKDQVSTNYLK